ncbi:MAG: alpha/beta hydrolase [Legionellaceae bacterium]|nr:alpha/beta hydrolase [Legionellaceae bacterium]
MSEQLGDKPKLHFSHGNGFPSPCYRQMLTALAPYFECDYIDKVGHTPEFPVLDNWEALTDEVIASVRSKSDEPVVAVGHSLGGVLNILAALKEPDLFKAIILLDSPLLSRIRQRGLHLSKALGFIDKITPAQRTQFRRRHWPTRDAAFGYLKRRELFKHFTDACLYDYIDYGMTQNASGCTLRFDSKIEYQIYRTMPHSLSAYPKKLHVPSALIYGSDSDVIHVTDRRHMQRRYGISSFKTEGTHMFPFEHPQATAELILKVILFLQKTKV